MYYTLHIVSSAYEQKHVLQEGENGHGNQGHIPLILGPWAFCESIIYRVIFCESLAKV